MAHRGPTKTQKKLGKTVDATLLRVIENGRDVVTKKGELVHIDATAADMTAAIRRLKDCGVTAEVQEVGAIQKALEERRGKSRRKGGLKLAG